MQLRAPPPFFFQGVVVVVVLLGGWYPNTTQPTAVAAAIVLFFNYSAYLRPTMTDVKPCHLCRSFHFYRPSMLLLLLQTEGMHVTSTEVFADVMPMRGKKKRGREKPNAVKHKLCSKLHTSMQYTSCVVLISAWAVLSQIRQEVRMY